MPLKLFTMVCGIVAFYAVIYGQNFAIMVRFKNASLSKNIGLIIAHEETHWYVMSFIKTAQTWSRLMGLKTAPESISVGLRNQTQLGNWRFHLVYPKVDWGGRYFPSTSSPRLRSLCWWWRRWYGGEAVCQSRRPLSQIHKMNYVRFMRK